MRENRYYLTGIIEFDDSYFGAKVKGKAGRAAGNQPVFVAVSLNPNGHPEYIKMSTTENVQRAAVSDFVRQNITPGSTVQTDGYKSYRKPLAENKCIHEYQNFDPDAELLKWLHSIIGNAKAFINGTYHGVSQKNRVKFVRNTAYAIFYIKNNSFVPCKI